MAKKKQPVPITSVHWSDRNRQGKEEAAEHPHIYQAGVELYYASQEDGILGKISAALLSITEYSTLNNNDGPTFENEICSQQFWLEPNSAKSDLLHRERLEAGA